MKVFFVLALSATVFAQECDPNCGACQDVHDIGIISCDSKKASCEVSEAATGNTGQIDLDYLVTGLKELTPEVCRRKCEEQSLHDDENVQDEQKCKFFHWTKGHPTGKDTCSLQFTCEGPDGFCENDDCISGEVHCDENCQPASPCSLGKTVWTHDKFHVTCVDKGAPGGDIDIYEKAQDLAHGTVCSTVRKCSEWEDPASVGNDYFRRLAVQCANGEWAAREDAGSEDKSTAMVADTNKITEQECEAICDPLEISDKNQYWASLVCDTPLGEDHILTEPNSCILLCDNHFYKTIDCEYDRKGDKAWRNAAGDVLHDADIKCPDFNH
jgi:hypothetical protein